MGWGGGTRCLCIRRVCGEAWGLWVPERCPVMPEGSNSEGSEHCSFGFSCPEADMQSGHCMKLGRAVWLLKLLEYLINFKIQRKKTQHSFQCFIKSWKINITTATKQKYESQKKSSLVPMSCIKSLHIPQVERLLYSYTLVTTVIFYNLILEKTFKEKQIFKYNFMTVAIQKIQ